jgi:hypothetical protein
MKFVIKVAVWIVAKLYFITGLEWLVEEIMFKVRAYRIRLNIVPVTFKWFVWILGLTTGISGSLVYFQAPEILHELTKASEPMVFIQKAHADFEEVKEVEKPKTLDVVDYIFLKESTRGKKNYSKCQEIGKFNRYGFGIPGNGEYVCFEEGEDTKAVQGWVAHRKALGWSDKEMLCYYNSGKKTEKCDDYLNLLGQ